MEVIKPTNFYKHGQITGSARAVPGPSFFFMNKTEKWLLIGGGLLLLFMSASGYALYLVPFLKQWEGFRAIPYWDKKQWSWGYGSRVPGSSDNPNNPPGGSITRAAAVTEMLNHVANDYSYLKSVITAPLNTRQWAALLSFSYNLGQGNADNLAANINAGNINALGQQWNLYINAGGQPDPDLIARRAAEWQLFNS